MWHCTSLPLQFQQLWRTPLRKNCSLHLLLSGSSIYGQAPRYDAHAVLTVLQHTSGWLIQGDALAATP